MILLYPYNNSMSKAITMKDKHYLSHFKDELNKA